VKHYTLTTSPAQEPVTPSSVVGFLRASCSAEELADAAGFIAVAREFAEGFTGRAFMLSAWRVVSDGWCGGVLTLDRSPLVAVSAVKYWPESGAQVTLDPGEYLVITSTEPGRVQITGDLPALAARADAVQIEFTAGATDAGAVPATLRHAVRLLATHYCENRSKNGTFDPTDIPNGVRNLLESQRVGGWVA
jgi:uncharacterized phiE125 gp8 family phage protein